MGQTLTVLAGLPGAGKSTLAALLVEKTGASLVARDELRKALVNAPDEAALTLLMISLAQALLAFGQSVVVDAWNLHPDDRRRWVELAGTAGIPCRWVSIETPVDECVRCDARRPNPVGEARVRAAAAAAA